MALRPIKPEERALIESLLALHSGTKKYAVPDQVENLGEGGLGGIQLSSKGKHAEDLVQANYKDEDGKPVLITLTISDGGELYDLDIWKMDFSPLRRYPTASGLTLAE